MSDIIIGGPCPCGFGPVGHDCAEARRRFEERNEEIAEVVQSVAFKQAVAAGVTPKHAAPALALAGWCPTCGPVTRLAGSMWCDVHQQHVAVGPGADLALRMHAALTKIEGMSDWAHDVRDAAAVARAALGGGK